MIKLKEIRKEKEALLQREDDEEEMVRTKRREYLERLREINRRQQEFEDKLAKEGRWEELKKEQEQRKIQTQHLMDLAEEYDQLNT